MRAALTPLHQLPSCKLHMELWDTAGAERFRSMCYTPFSQQRRWKGARQLRDLVSIQARL